MRDTVKCMDCRVESNPPKGTVLEFPKFIIDMGWMLKKSGGYVCPKCKRIYCIDCVSHRKRGGVSLGCWNKQHVITKRSPLREFVVGGEIYNINRDGQCESYKERIIEPHSHPSHWYSTTLDAFCEEFQYEWELLHVLNDLYQVNIICTRKGNLWLEPGSLGTKPNMLEDMELSVCTMVMDFRIRHGKTTRVGGSKSLETSGK